MIKRLVDYGIDLSLDSKDHGVLKELLKPEVYGNVEILLTLKLVLNMKLYIMFSSEDLL
jgi:hypothetical protein